MAKMLLTSDTLGITLRYAAVMIATVIPICAADPGTRLESAIHLEVVLGDVNGAIDQYRSIAEDAASPRPVAASALLHMGQCFDKSGQPGAARVAYAKVLKGFAEEPEAAAARKRLGQMESSRGASFAGPRNLRFELGGAGKAPLGWIVPALPQVADHWAEVRTSGCREIGNCAVLLIPDNAPGFGYLLQSFSATPYRGKTVQLRAWIRIEAEDSYDRAQMSLSVDRSKGQAGFYNDMNDRPVQSAEWTLREIRTQVYDDATFITVGVISKGRGRVWLDSVSFEVIR
jgi:hypothetical protein